eukprot:6352613-Amphidinium_carterae.1
MLELLDHKGRAQGKTKRHCAKSSSPTGPKQVRTMLSYSLSFLLKGTRQFLEGQHASSPEQWLLQ